MLLWQVDQAITCNVNYSPMASFNIFCMGFDTGNTSLYIAWASPWTTSFTRSLLRSYEGKAADQHVCKVEHVRG